MFRKKGNDCWLRHQREAFSSDGSQQGRFVTKGEEHTFTRARGLQQRGDHGSGPLRKILLPRHLGTEIGERLDGP